MATPWRLINRLDFALLDPSFAMTRLFPWWIPRAIDGMYLRWNENGGLEKNQAKCTTQT